MHVLIENETPKVEGLPAGVEILFLAKIDESLGFCVIFGPSETCLPKEPRNFSELWDAKLAIGKEGDDMQIHNVTHGHKYLQGGGFVETKYGGQVFFRIKGNDKPSTYEGRKIEIVYKAL